MTFLTGTDELTEMTPMTFETTIASDNPTKITCNNMGFLGHLLSSDFGGYFDHFWLIFYATESRRNRCSTNGPRLGPHRPPHS